MKIELDLPQVPEGWRCIGYHIPKKGQGIIDEFGSFWISNKDFITSYFLTFERIEPEDTELEEAKRLIGTWVMVSDQDEAFLVKQVYRHKSDIYVKSENWDQPFYTVTPFPLPVWRCCDADKPKKSQCCFVRTKDDHELKFTNLFTELTGWDSTNQQAYEWLDEGER